MVKFPEMLGFISTLTYRYDEHYCQYSVTVPVFGGKIFYDEGHETMWLVMHVVPIGTTGYSGIFPRNLSDFSTTLSQLYEF